MSPQSVSAAACMPGGVPSVQTGIADTKVIADHLAVQAIIRSYQVCIILKIIKCTQANKTKF